MDINIYSFIMGVLGFIASTLGIGYAIWNTRRFTKGVNYSSLLSIRSLLNRIEE